MTRDRFAALAHDPETRAIIRGTLVVEPTGDIEIRLPHRLQSPNKTLWASRWEKKHDKDAWLARVRRALCDAAGLTSLAAFHQHPIAALGLPPVTERRRLRFERHVPSIRNFIQDERNLQFAPKHLEDCLTDLGFIRDDTRRWVELAPVTQRVSDDGRDWTVIRIEIPADASMPLPAVPAARNRVSSR